MADILQKVKTCREFLCRECEYDDMRLEKGETACTLQLFDDVEKALEQKKGEWIPVTERLPDEPGFYIVYTDSSYNPIRMLRYGMAAPVAFRNENNWYDEKGQHIYSWLVKYWMPLPEPPKEET